MRNPVNLTGILFPVEAPAGGTCGSAPWWRTITNGFKYRDPNRDPSGMDELMLKAGPAGRGRMKASARGVIFLDVAPLPFALPVVVQLVAADGACWQRAYFAGDVTRNRG